MRCICSVLLLSVAVLNVGCMRVTGLWSLADVTPTAARRDFAYESLTLQKDGTFYAEAREPKIKSVSGTWTLDRDHVLTLREQDGETHTYDAKLIEGGSRLQLVSHWEGRRMTAVMEKKEES